MVASTTISAMHAASASGLIFRIVVKEIIRKMDWKNTITYLDGRAMGQAALQLQHRAREFVA